MDKNQLASLVEQANAGNTGAFTQLYEIFSSRIYYLAFQVTKSSFDAEDVVQETMLRLHHKLSSLRDPQALNAFVTQTAYHCSVDVLRKRKVVFTEDYDLTEPVTDLDSEFIPSAFLETKQQREYIQQLVFQLSEGQRAAVVLFYFEDLSIKQIAQVMGTSEQVVKSRLFRARETLKAKLKKDQNARGAWMLLPLSNLGRIFELNSQEAFTPEMSAKCLEKIGQELGMNLSTTNSSDTTPKSNQSNHLPKRSSAFSTGGVVAACIGILAVCLGIFSYITFQGNDIVPQIAPPAIVSEAESKPSTEDSSLHSNSSPESVSSSQESSSSSPSSSSSSSSSSSPSSSSSKNSSPNSSSTSSSSSAESDTPSLSDPASSEASSTISNARRDYQDSDSSGHKSGGGVSSQNKELMVFARNLAVDYPVGVAVPVETILADANVTTSRTAVIRTSHYEQINFSIPDEYVLYVWAEDASQQISQRIVIVVVVEEKQ